MLSSDRYRAARGAARGEGMRLAIAVESAEKQPMGTHVREQLPHFVAVTDDAYDRMMERLTSGERYAFTYTGTCPHKDNKDCVCEKKLNFLKDGKIVRMEGGVQKQVYKLSDVMAWATTQ